MTESAVSDPRRHTALVEAIGSAILEAADATSDGTGDGTDPLALVRHAADAESASRELLHQAVSTARSEGHSWAAIGATLGMSRQAVQQRFGERAASADQVEAPGNGGTRWLGPVTAFDEMRELELAGRQGWHTVRAGMLRHLVERGDTQWEHKRVIWTGSLARYEKDGWSVGARALPWVYLVRDTGLPLEP